MSKKIITHNNGIIETRETFYTEKTIQQLKQQLVEKDTRIAAMSTAKIKLQGTSYRLIEQQETSIF